MITTSKESKLVSLYCAICQHYDNTLVARVQRLSNYFRPKFTDAECLTIYLFGLSEQKFTVKATYEFIKDYFHEWFPGLPSYQAFDHRICFLSEAFQELCCLLISEHGLGIGHTFLLDSMPIAVANAKRSGKARVAAELCTKSYCASQDKWYYGVKLHVLGQKVYHALPKMVMAQIAPAHEHDCSVAKDMLQSVYHIDLFADKAYIDTNWHTQVKKQGILVYTPVKLEKGQKYLSSPDNAFSQLLAQARQARESFFNWINDKTRIQFASKVRSEKGLISFIFARIATATTYP
jgi:hypothetical protein